MGQKTKERPKAVSRLRHELTKALDERNIDKLAEHAKGLGPHIQRMERTVRSSNGKPKLSCEVDGTPYITTRTDLPIEVACRFADLMQIDTATVAEAVENTLEELDAEVQFEEMKGLIDHLIAKPEYGLVAVEENNKTAMRPARTWRFAQVDPDRAERWRKRPSR